MKTAFRPSVHGWHFRNRFAYSPSVGPVRVPLRLSFGFCGGMSFAALDRFHAGAHVSDEATIPTQGSALYEELYRRQRQSLRGAVWLKVYAWQTTPDEDSGSRRGLGALTAREWQEVKAGLDAGAPQVICLIRARGWRGNLSRNHQVVAYAYEHDPAAGRVKLWIYDPNHPRSERVTLEFSLGRPGNRLEGVQSTGEPFRGFFRMRYEPAPVRER